MAKTAVIEKPATPDMEVQEEILARILQTGDISGLTHAQKWAYTKMVCAHVGVDPITQPFKILQKKNKDGSMVETLYATKACGDQLAKKHDLTVEPGEVEILEDLGICKCRAKVSEIDVTADARIYRIATGFVPIKEFDQRTGQLKLLAPADLCNALMKCETKAVQRGILGRVGLGMPSETEIETIPDAQVNVINEDIEAQGQILTMTHRAEVKEWWRNALASGDYVDFDDERKMAAACLAELKYVTPLARSRDDMNRLREQMIDEVLEVARADQSVKTGQSIEKVEAIPEPQIKPEKLLTDAQIEKCIKWLEKKYKDGSKESPAILVVECLAALKYAGTDARANQLFEAWLKDPKYGAGSTESTDSLGSTQVDTPTVDANAEPDNQAPNTETMDEIRARTPQIAELQGRKKPLNNRVEAQLNSALITLQDLRDAKSEREGEEGAPVNPLPNWNDTSRVLIRKVTDAAGWDEARAQNAMKHRWQLHAESINKLTWEKLEQILRWFAGTHPEDYEMKK